MESDRRRRSASHLHSRSRRTLRPTKRVASARETLLTSLAFLEWFAGREEILLARDAVNATGGLDFNILDTYAVALDADGQREAAARVGVRVIAVCDALEARCNEVRPHAEDLMRAR